METGISQHRSPEDFVPVTLVMDGWKKTPVKSIYDMAEALMVSWPSEDGEEYVAAVRVCLDALCGDRAACDARAALIRAAEEAEIPAIGMAQ